MVEKSELTMGRCFCGSIRYEATGAPDFVAYCHCDDCRRATGAPVSLYVTFPEGQVRFTNGDRKAFESTEGVRRTFCADCGTPLAYEADWEGQTVIGFFVGTLDEPEKFPPDRHSFDIDRLGWFDIADRLPHFHQTAAGNEPVRIGPASELLE